jgi:hydroxypyruvate reductase
MPKCGNNSLNSLKEEILYFFRLGVHAADPNSLFEDFWEDHSLLQETFHTSKKNLFVFSVGKAAYPMAMSFVHDFPIKNGYILTKYGHLPTEKQIIQEDSIWKYREASHPILDQNSIDHSNEVLNLLKQLGKDDRLVVLLSGGASSLFEIPIEGYSLIDMISIQKRLLNSGKFIHEINLERKKSSKVKGGKLLSELNSELEVYTFVISDVIGNDPNTIGSGPTYPSENYFILGNLTKSIQTIIHKAKQLGYQTKCISDTWTGSVEETSYLIEKEFLSAIESNTKQMVLIGGELVCPVNGNGVGGRNQELALRIAILLEKHQVNRNWVFLSAGTDGTDGPTDAAGGVVTNNTIALMKEKKWDPIIQLEDSNSYPILKDVNALVMTGPTGTNVNDILILLVEGSES